MRKVLSLIRTYAVGGLAALVLVLGLGAWMMARQADSPATENHALTDAAATAAVQASVSKTLVNVLSYDYSAPQTSQAAADEFLTGQARKEYDVLVKTLHKKAPGQQLVLSATIQAAGVKTLTADSATLLVFLDQSSQRVGDKQASVSAAQLSITAAKTGGIWKITGLKTL